MPSEPIMPQDTPEEPRPTDELADEQLDEVNGGFIWFEQPAVPQQPQLPQVSQDFQFIKK